MRDLFGREIEMRDIKTLRLSCGRYATTQQKQAETARSDKRTALYLTSVQTGQADIIRHLTEENQKLKRLLRINKL